MAAAGAEPFEIALASGDGIGPEVCAQATRVLDAVGTAFGHSFRFTTALVGGAAWEATGSHLPPATLETCARADAILFGSVGGPVHLQHEPKWADAERTAILGMRKHFSLAINVRPAKVYAALAHLSPLKAEVRGLPTAAARMPTRAAPCLCLPARPSRSLARASTLSSYVSSSAARTLARTRRRLTAASRATT